MQVLFLQNVTGVARKGDVKNVKEGYFKNFLVRQKLAIKADGAVLKQAEKMKKNEIIQKERLLAEAGDVVKKIDGTVIVISAKSSGEKLYGSISEKEILDELEKLKKVRLEKSHLVMPEHIKTVGVHDVTVKIMDGAEAIIKVEIKGEEK